MHYTCASYEVYTSVIQRLQYMPNEQIKTVCTSVEIGVLIYVSLSWKTTILNKSIQTRKQIAFQLSSSRALIISSIKSIRC